LNKKLKKLARKSALSYKAKDENITVIEDFNFETPKTKNFSEMLKNFQLTGKKTLVVVSKTEENVILASRNLKRLKVMHVTELNTYEILDATRLLITESSLREIENIHQN
jgi:large subunit ribosomal protein L4